MGSETFIPRIGCVGEGCDGGSAHDDMCVMNVDVGVCACPWSLPPRGASPGRESLQIARDHTAEMHAVHPVAWLIVFACVAFGAGPGGFTNPSISQTQIS